MERAEWRPRRLWATALHAAFREGFPRVLAEAEARAGMPRRVRSEVGRYLGCGDVRRGFVQVRCGGCRTSSLVTFSCKQRLCPSCGARRSHETAALCGALLPEVPYRQWTLSAPFRLRWSLAKHPKLLAAMERRLVRAVWAWTRRWAKRLWAKARLEGAAVGFRQYFGSALQLTPHLHVLVPADVWQCPCGGRRRVVAVVSDRRTAEEVLRNMGLLPSHAAHVPRPGRSPPQFALAV